MLTRMPQTVLQKLKDPKVLFLTGGEVAELFRVDTKTVGRWAKAGRLPHVRTLGGHRRFPKQQIIERLADGYPQTLSRPDSTPDVTERSPI